MNISQLKIMGFFHVKLTNFRLRDVLVIKVYNTRQ